MVKQNWKQMGEKIFWVALIGIPVIFFQAVLHYYITKDLPEEGNFLGIFYSNIPFVWGLTLLTLIIIWFLIKNIFKIKEKRGKL